MSPKKPKKKSNVDPNYKKQDRYPSGNEGRKHPGLKHPGYRFPPPQGKEAE